MSEEEILEKAEEELEYGENCTYKYLLRQVLNLYQKEKEKEKNNPDYIHKDKIRELLQRYDKGIAWANADDHYYFVKFIKELLKE